MLLLGIEEADDMKDVKWLCRKISQLRLFDDEEGKINKDLLEVGGQILVISQFTLHAKYKKGNRPSFIRAARPEKAKPLYHAFIEEIQQITGQKVESGIFGAMMTIELENHGPVTLFLDSQNKE